MRLCFGGTGKGGGSGSNTSPAGPRICGTGGAPESFTGGGGALTGGGGASTGAGLTKGGNGGIAVAGRSSAEPVAGTAGATIPAGTGAGTFGFSLNLTAASLASAASGGGKMGGSAGDDFSPGGNTPIGGSDSGGGSAGSAPTAADCACGSLGGAAGITGTDVTSTGVTDCVGCGLMASRGFNRTRGSVEAFPSDFSPNAGAGGVAGAAGMGAEEEERGLPVDPGEGATGAAGAGSFPTCRRGFKRRAGGWDSSLMPGAKRFFRRSENKKIGSPRGTRTTH